MKYIFFFIFCFVFFQGFSQPTNINVSIGNVFDGEPYLAVNPTNPQNMVAAWMSFALGGIPRIAIKTKTSFDGGSTWNNLVVHPHAGATLHSADVSMAFRNDGTLFIDYIDYRQSPDTGFIFIQQSTDGGNTWSNPVKVWDIHEDLAKEPMDRPWLVIDNSNTANAGMLYLTTKPAPWISPPNRPYLKYSADSGQTWSSYRYVDSTGYLVGNTIAAPMGAPTVTADGALCVAYASYLPAQSVLPQYIIAKSYNRSIEFDYHTIYSGIPGAIDTNYKLGHHFTANPANSNQLTMAIVINKNGDPDIYTASSNDGGTSWNTIVRVNDDSIGNGVAQDMVWAQYATNGDLLVTWRDRRNAGTGFFVGSDFYSAVSHDNGATFQKNIRLSNVTAAFDSVLLQNGNDFMSCYLVNDTICALWGDVRSGKLNIYFAKTSDSTGLTTGLVKISEEEIFAVSVYPSPAQNDFSIILPADKESATIELLNETGQLVMRKENVSSNQRIDCSQLSSGIYFLRITSGNDVCLKKLNINR